MNLSNLMVRVKSRYQRSVGGWLFRRPFAMPAERPYVSFTFDDFPVSALHTGGEILRAAGARGTYYAAFGLMDSDAPTSRIFGTRDIAPLLAAGHELACHTFAHCDSWDTNSGDFDASLADNERALRAHAPGVLFRSFSYPISSPHPLVKRVAARRFESCRGGGQTFNADVADLALLKSFFIEKSAHRPEAIKAVIDDNAAARGWLIFSTHDVRDNPTQYGCTPELLRRVLDWSLASGAIVLPVAEALDALGVRRMPEAA
ncbi:MAG TPA: polysaccharide deacetylase family protein [Steroidobacteraceae bacterium]|nr:polysaccharide deacetylase family protein [Steroidobacteraceae bacterium]